MGKTIEYYRDIIASWKHAKVLVLGDAMLDEYIVGNATRISPEAPVPVVCAREYRTRLGGACNVVQNIKALGGSPLLFSFVGDDSYACKLKALLEEEEIEAHLYTLSTIPTTVKTRVMTESQQIVRIDREEKANPPASLIATLVADIKKLIDKIDIVIYSDYAKGFFSALMIEELTKVWNELPNPPKILVDPKVCNIPLFKDVFLITPNSKETEESTGVHITDEESLYEAGRILFDICNCTHVLTTLGEKGMALFRNPRDMEYIAGIPQDVFDVTGAGDAVIATVAFALANGTSLEDAVWIANCAGGYSVCHIGVVAITKKELLQTVDSVLQTNSL